MATVFLNPRALNIGSSIIFSNCQSHWGFALRVMGFFSYFLVEKKGNNFVYNKKISVGFSLNRDIKRGISFLLTLRPPKKASPSNLFTKRKYMTPLNGRLPAT
jgi:hypothetical protein